MSKTISAFTATKNVVTRGAPLLECVASAIHGVDEWVFQDCQSTDGTLEILDAMAAVNPKIKVFRGAILDSSPLGLGLRSVYQRARRRCTKDFIMEIQCDEVFEDGVIASIKEALDGNSSIRSLSYLIDTLDTWDFARARPWSGWRLRVALNCDDVEVQGPAYDVTYLAPHMKIKQQCWNVGYVFVENILEKWKQNLLSNPSTLLPSEKMAAEANVLDEYVPIRASWVKAEPLKPVDRSSLPAILHPLFDLRRYAPRMDLLDMIGAP